jgi:hypothetical protein
MVSPPLHRRLRISLRGLLLLLTAFCIWASIHGQWIRDRREARAWIVSHEVGPWSGVDSADVKVQMTINGQQVWVPDIAPELPLSLRILRERPLYYIHLDKSKLTPHDAARIDSLQRLFPEADGIHIQEPRWTQRWPPDDVEEYFANPFPASKTPKEAPLTTPLIPVN